MIDFTAAGRAPAADEGQNRRIDAAETFEP